MNEFAWPSNVTSEALAKAFMKLCMERYYTSSKVKDSAVTLLKVFPNNPKDTYKALVCKILILSSFRDGVRQVSLHQFFKTAARRDELYMAIIEALEDYEDELEALEEELNINVEIE